MSDMQKKWAESAELTGTAKKFNKELEALPFESHAAIIGILGVLVQHRQAVERGRMEEQARIRELGMKFNVPSMVANPTLVQQ